MYIQWDTSAETAVGVPSNAPPLVYDYGYWVPCQMPARRTSLAQTLHWSLVDGVAVGEWVGSDDPLDAPASHDIINSRHRELETSPITVFGESFDCDEKSELRMRDAIAYWDDRPLEPGVFELREIEGVETKVIIWTRGDNTNADLTKDQLEFIFEEMKKQRALRAAILFAHLRQFKSNPATSLRDIQELASWGI